MEMNDLIKSLREQYQFLEAFLNTIMIQQRAIIENDMTGLEETVKTEGALIIQIDHKEKQMVNIISELSDKYKIDLPAIKLTDFVDAVKARKDIKIGNLDRIQNALKKMTVKIANVNAQNKILIDQARNFIQETVTRLINLNKNQLLDRKI